MYHIRTRNNWIYKSKFRRFMDRPGIQDSLGEAVNMLNDYNVPVSVYNHQLCLINKRVYKFNVQSILIGKMNI